MSDQSVCRLAVSGEQVAFPVAVEMLLVFVLTTVLRCLAVDIGFLIWVVLDNLEFPYSERVRRVENSLPYLRFGFHVFLLSLLWLFFLVFLKTIFVSGFHAEDRHELFDLLVHLGEFCIAIRLKNSVLDCEVLVKNHADL